MHWRQQAAALAAKSGMLGAAERIEALRPNMLRILVYHRIGDPRAEADRADPSLFSATAEEFAWQMAYLKENYNVITPEVLFASVDGEAELPPRAVMVTFDDAYQDFATHAWPVVSQLDVPTVMFAATDYLSHDGSGSKSFWWDELYNAIIGSDCESFELPSVGTWTLSDHCERVEMFMAIKHWLKGQPHREAMQQVDRIIRALGGLKNPTPTCMSWETLRVMSDEGLYVGPHTCSHPLLSRISLEEAWREIAGSQDALKAQLGTTLPLFAYPSGQPADYRTELYRVLQSEGIRAAVTTIEGHNVLGRVPAFSLRRVGLAPYLTPDEFRLVLTGAYNVYGLYLRLRTHLNHRAAQRDVVASKSIEAAI